MAVSVSLRGVANTVLFVVGAFMIGDVLHRSVVTGEVELLAAESVVRIALGCVILVGAYLVGVPREEQEAALGRGDGNGGADDGAGTNDGVGANDAADGEEA